jgi:hypothetical protein
LIEAHWLEGLLLWGCLTGLRKENGFENLHKKEKTGKGRFWGWMYSVRQVVALYHIRRTLWLDTSVACLKCWNAFEGDDDKDERPWETVSDAELVEAVVALLTETIKYRLSYMGFFGYGNEDDIEEFGYFFHSGRKCTATEMEHAKVHLVNKYCMRIGKILKGELGDRYGEWERLEDEKMVPMNILL